MIIIPGQSWPPLSGAGHPHCLVFSLNSPVSCGRQGVYSPHAHQSPSTAIIDVKWQSVHAKTVCLVSLDFTSMQFGIPLPEKIYSLQMCLISAMVCRDNKILAALIFIFLDLSCFFVWKGTLEGVYLYINIRYPPWILSELLPKQRWSETTDTKTKNVIGHDGQLTTIYWSLN